MQLFAAYKSTDFTRDTIKIILQKCTKQFKKMFIQMLYEIHITTSTTKSYKIWLTQPPDSLGSLM